MTPCQSYLSCRREGRQHQEGPEKAAALLCSAQRVSWEPPPPLRLRLRLHRRHRPLHRRPLLPLLPLLLHRLLLRRHLRHHPPS